MKTIGIRELKNQLSAVLREVRRGEVVQVTDRGRVIALVSPADGAPADEPPLERLLREGRVQRAQEAWSPDFLLAHPRTGTGTPRDAAEAILSWSRGERLGTEP